MEYDYIIAGAGCAGLSLAYRMSLSPVLSRKSVLIIDTEKKLNNDRTWCFWEKGVNTFEDIVHKEWKRLLFQSHDFQNEFELKDYAYKMIKGDDFYSFVWNQLDQHSNIEFRKEAIKEIKVSDQKAVVVTVHQSYHAEFIFNSTGMFNPDINEENSLLQHFMGWVIETKEDRFNPDLATLMDFSIPQDLGATFMYVLPTSSNQALVEYTLFNEKVLDKEEYRIALKNYISNRLNLDQYDIIHEEYGVIPMSLANFERHIDERIINIGTAGGYTKASSGYTFYAIQEHSKQVIALLEDEKSPAIDKRFRDKMFDWYDRTLLDVMINKKMSGEKIFATLFKKIDPEKILTFLSNESHFKDELKIMLSLNSKSFITSGIQQLAAKH